MRPILVTGLSIVCAIVCGCRDSQSTAEMHDMLRDYGRLPGLRQTTHDGLRDELARIEEESATPEQLMSGGIPDNNNVAVALSELFAERKLSTILERSTEIYPPDGFRFDPLRLQRAADFVNRHRRQLDNLRRALKRNQCDLRLDHLKGYAADTSFIELVRICGRLEAFHVAELLAAGKRAEAIHSLSSMLTLARWLGAEKHAVARLQAAFLRSEAWDVLSAVAEHRETTDETIVQLEQLVSDHLAVWPDDRDAWVGDRALGMHAYEMIRAGHLQSLLTVDELKMFSDEGIGGELAVAVHRHLDEDQMYYLSTMRRLIDGCRRPYYERKQLFEQLRSDLQQRSGRSDYPFIAARLLLIDVERGHQIQAQDRALAEGWAVALALAVGHDAPFTLNPLTGRPYHVSVEETRVVVSDTAAIGSDGDRRLVVPRVRVSTTNPGSR